MSTNEHKPIILGGGLAGLSLAYFLKKDSIILEKEKQLGGLCRSFEFNRVFYDIGPHILFSKNKRILSMLTSLLKTSKIKRSSKIYHKGRLIKYPFENDLAGLNNEDKEYCLNEFLHNPYENCQPQNMLQFFLKTFGEGITRLYLEPYNQKIWKFDPAFMDTQMVERIPKPPKSDVIKSAKGFVTEGHKHQLYFRYPERGGIEQIISAFSRNIASKAKIIHPLRIQKIYKDRGIWRVGTSKGTFSSQCLINCLPLHELFKLIEAPKNILQALDDLKYNSIYIIVVQAKKDNIGDNLSLNFADRDIIFHRITKLNFLGKNYRPKNNGSTILVEITYRPKSYLAGLDKEEIKKRAMNDLDRLNLIKNKDVVGADFKNFKYAYIIYDLNHRKNTDKVLEHLAGLGISCCGRFAEFEYLNMDAVLDHSYKLAKKLNDQQH